MDENERAVAFGQYLKELRKEQGLTLIELGERVNLSNPYLSQIETGKRGFPDAELLEKLAEHLNIDFLTLLSKAWEFKNDRPLIKDPESSNFDLIELLKDQQLNIQGKTLTPKEREQILGVLKVFFPTNNGG